MDFFTENYNRISITCFFLLDRPLLFGEIEHKSPSLQEIVLLLLFYIPAQIWLSSQVARGLPWATKSMVLCFVLLTLGTASNVAHGVHVDNVFNVGRHDLYEVGYMLISVAGLAAAIADATPEKARKAPKVDGKT